MLQKTYLAVITVFCFGVLSAQPYMNAGVVQSYHPGTKTVQKLKLTKDAVIQGISFDKD